MGGRILFWVIVMIHAVVSTALGWNITTWQYWYNFALLIASNGAGYWQGLSPNGGYPK